MDQRTIAARSVKQFCDRYKVSLVPGLFEQIYDRAAPLEIASRCYYTGQQLTPAQKAKYLQVWRQFFEDSVSLDFIRSRGWELSFVGIDLAELITRIERHQSSVFTESAPLHVDLRVTRLYRSSGVPQVKDLSNTERDFRRLFRECGGFARFLRKGVDLRYGSSFAKVPPFAGCQFAVQIVVGHRFQPAIAPHDPFNEFFETSAIEHSKAHLPPSMRTLVVDNESRKAISQLQMAVCLEYRDLLVMDESSMMPALFEMNGKSPTGTRYYEAYQALEYGEFKKQWEQRKQDERKRLEARIPR